MKKYMVIACGEIEKNVSFHDTYSEAENAYNYYISIGWESEVYERGVFEKDCMEEYRLLFA